MSKPVSMAKFSGILAWLGFVGRALSKVTCVFHPASFSCDLGQAGQIDPIVEFWHSVIGLAIHDDWPNWNTSSKGVPVLGDHVMVGAGAVVLGSFRIGNGASIGANAVCLIDVSDGCTVAGVPARIIKRPLKPAGGDVR